MIDDFPIGPRAPLGPELVNPDLLLEPLDYLAAEHSRQHAAMRQLGWLIELKRGRAWTALAQSTLAFLQTDLPRHADDERDLLALLRRRCPPERLETVAEMLAAKHAADRALGMQIAAALDAAAVDRGHRLGTDFADLIEPFVSLNRRCLPWEDANVLPLAKQFLSRRDLNKLAATMAARRGITLDRRGRSVRSPGR